MSIISNLIKTSGNEYASIVSQGTVFDSECVYSLGNYLLNAQISGSMFGGFRDVSRIILAGPKSTGKTYLMLEAIKDFLNRDENNYLIYFEGEGAVNKQMLIDRGLPVDRIVLLPIKTVEEFKEQAAKILDKIKEDRKKNGSKEKYMMCLDSIGILGSHKEVEDAINGKQVADMSRAKVIKSAFRIITLDLAMLKMPFIATSHTYSNIMGGMYAPDEMSGGTGPQYSADIIVYLSKALDREESGKRKVVGGVFTSKLMKARNTKEQTVVKFKINFEKGLLPYSGLFEYCKEREVIVKQGIRYKFKWQNDEGLVKRRVIEETPEKFFTEDNMKKLDTYMEKWFCYQQESDMDDIVEEVKDEIDVFES